MIPEATTASRAASPMARNKKVDEKARKNTGESTGEKDVPSLRDLIREDAEAAFARVPHS